MAGTGLIHCVLIQVLLIAVSGNSKKTQFEINCLNPSGTVGEQLHLVCDVQCVGCKVKQFSWTKEQDPDLSCHDDPIDYELVKRFVCTIPSASQKHNGTFEFWVQLANGNKQISFNVTLALAPTANTYYEPQVQFPDTSDSIPDPDEPKQEENGRSPMVVVAVMVMFCFAISMGVFIILRKKDNSMSSSAQDLSGIV